MLTKEPSDKHLAKNPVEQMGDLFTLFMSFKDTWNSHLITHLCKEIIFKLWL